MAKQQNKIQCKHYYGIYDYYYTERELFFDSQYKPIVFITNKPTKKEYQSDCEEYVYFEHCPKCGKKLITY